MDTDRDGRVALVEYQDWLSYAFDAMDRDRDGVLSPAELPGGRGKPVTRGRASRTRWRPHSAARTATATASSTRRELAAPPQ